MHTQIGFFKRNNYLRWCWRRRCRSMFCCTSSANCWRSVIVIVTGVFSVLTPLGDRLFRTCRWWCFVDSVGLCDTVIYRDFQHFLRLTRSHFYNQIHQETKYYPLQSQFSQACVCITCGGGGGSTIPFLEENSFHPKIPPSLLVVCTCTLSFSIAAFKLFCLIVSFVVSLLLSLFFMCFRLLLSRWRLSL